MEVDDFLEKLKVDISNAEKDLEKINDEIKKARAIGLDVSEQLARYDAQKKQLELIHKVYKI